MKKKSLAKLIQLKETDDLWRIRNMEEIYGEEEI